MANILLCADELHASLAAVRGLHDGGHVPYLAVCTRDTYASYSRFTAGTLDVPDPDFDPEGFAMAVGAIGAKIGADAILPGTETSLVSSLATPRLCRQRSPSARHPLIRS